MQLFRYAIDAPQELDYQEEPRKPRRFAVFQKKSRAKKEECWGPIPTPTPAPEKHNTMSSARNSPNHPRGGSERRTYRAGRRWRDLPGGPSPLRGDVGDVSERDALLGLRGGGARRLGPPGALGHGGALGGGGGGAAGGGDGRHPPRRA